MLFNVLGFNQEKLISIHEEIGIKLNGNDLIVLRNMVDMIESNRLETRTINNRIYTRIKYSLLVENLAVVSDKEDTFKKIVTKLIKCSLLERKVLKSVGNGAYTFFAKTEVLNSLLKKTLQDTKSKKNDEEYKKAVTTDKVADTVIETVEDLEEHLSFNNPKLIALYEDYGHIKTREVVLYTID